MKISVSRQKSCDALLRILENGEFSHIVLRDILNGKSGKNTISERDTALVTRITEGTTEYLYQIDYIINSFSSLPVENKRMKPYIRTVLRMSTYQILYLRLPDMAAINDGVNLVKKKGYSSLAGFVNAVLRKISGSKEELLEGLKHAPEHIRYSVPKGFYDYLFSVYGKEETERMLKWFLEGENITYIRTREGKCETLTGNVIDNASFKRGDFTVQDYSSQQVGILSGVKKGMHILDMCASPGGKTSHISQLLEGTGYVEARDISEEKIELIRENIERLGLKNVICRVFDATVFDDTLTENGKGLMDMVLSDVPCSGFGILKKKPDIRLSFSLDRVNELRTLQRKILKNAMEYVKESGKLIFSTCTLTLEENEENRDFILSDGRFILEKEKKLLPGNPSDGFYICIFKRKKDA